jgi:hypothetical protein
MMKKRIFFLALALMMCLALLSSAALAADPVGLVTDVKSARNSPYIDGNGNGLLYADIVYFGSYPQSAYAPANIPQSPAERAAIVNSEIHTYTWQNANTSASKEFYSTVDQDGSPVTDKIFLLSTDEAVNNAYGFSHNFDRSSGYEKSPERLAATTAYARGRGVLAGAGADFDNTDRVSWWLRSPSNPGGKSKFAGMVEFHGAVAGAVVDYHVTTTGNPFSAVRPALKLDLKTLESGVTTPILSANAGVPPPRPESTMQLTNSNTRTISVPEAPDVVFTAENIYDQYVTHQYSFLSSQGLADNSFPTYVFFYDKPFTIACNKDVMFYGYSAYDEVAVWGGTSAAKAANAIVPVEDSVYELSVGITSDGTVFDMQYYTDVADEWKSEFSPIAYLIFVRGSAESGRYYEKAPEDYSWATGYALRSFDSKILTTPQPPTPATAKPTASTVLVNGINVAFDAYNINDNNYFKLRDLAFAITGSEKQFEVKWDDAKNAINLLSGDPYTVVGGEMTAKGAGNKTPTLTSSKIYLDGKEVALTAYNIEGNNYFKLRDIGQAFDFGVDWDGAANTIVIDTSKGYTPE